MHLDDVILLVCVAILNVALLNTHRRVVIRSVLLVLSTGTYFMADHRRYICAVIHRFTLVET
jgi:hypothetical protein